MLLEVGGGSGGVDVAGTWLQGSLFSNFRGERSDQHIWQANCGQNWLLVKSRFDPVASPLESLNFIMIWRFLLYICFNCLQSFLLQKILLLLLASYVIGAMWVKSLTFHGI